MNKLLYILIFLLGSLGLSAQSVDVNASIDTNFLLIGEQTQIELKVQYRLDGEPISVKFPELKDTISEFIEIVTTSSVDTTYPDQNDLSLVEQVQRITITSFDSGSYEIPYFEFQINEGLFQTGLLLIEVRPMEVDTAEAIFDIRGPIEEPFSFVDWIKDNWIWIALVLVLLIGGILLIVYLKNRPEKVIEEEVIPLIPPHIIALEKLEKLREDKLWQDGKVKLFHSEISEIIREYLEKRYSVNALENTTDEIMQSLRFMSIDPTQLSKLNQLLVLSDLVKFAKEQPLANENDMSLLNAIDFINATKWSDEEFNSMIEAKKEKALMSKQQKNEKSSILKISNVKPEVKNNTNIKKIIAAIVGFVVIFLIFQFYFTSTTLIDKQLSKMASEINESCPMMVDAETQMDNTVALPEKTIQYNYTLIKIDKDEIDIDIVRETLRPSILNIIRTDPGMKTLTDIDVTFIYNYRDKNSEHILKFTFTPDEYNNNAE